MQSKPYFTHINQLIQDELAKAEHSIRVAVAWFTDRQLFEELLEKAATDVSVLVIVRHDVINFNPNALDWQQLLDRGATLFVAPISPALHHKFCLIDETCLVSGSYNWTYGARRNRENVVVHQQPELAHAFRKEFDFLLDQSQEVTNVATFLAAFPPVVEDDLRAQTVLETTLRAEAEQLHRQGEDYEGLVLAANAAYCQKQYELATDNLQQALNLRPNGAEEHHLLAGVYWRTQQFQQAIVAAEKAEELGIDSAPLCNTFGLAFDGLGKFKEAIAYFDRSIRAEPTIATWYYNKCMALDRWGRESLGDKAASESIRIASDEIKRHRDGSDDQRLLRAYIERAGLRMDKVEARKDARAALEVFERLTIEERDMHDLDDIQKVLR